MRPWLSRLSPHSRAAALALLAWAGVAQATDVQVVGLGEDKAVVVIDGGRPRTLRAGQSSPEGVKLISADSQQAVIEIDGKREALSLGRGISAATVTTDSPSVSLIADARGHFIANGSLNGASTKLMVDTGASLVVFSSNDAKRMGISYLQGERSYANTASGVAPFYRIILNTVKVGGITLNQVEAGVMEGGFPQMPLLGLSFLNRLEMRREGSAMTLTKKY
ncbi:MAG TPA: TIGR02281 family clan AA aspartic protease [Burkholderiales bacterium]|nr:TIGR02281 family clan AA aspartic protease [Burkholderiales bacterium]